MIKNLNKAMQAMSGVFRAQNYHGVLVTATTNSAADSLNNDTGYGEVTTIHSALSLMVQNGKLMQRSNTGWHNHIVIVDEYTLIDWELFKYLDNATSKVILVGDADQLLAIKGMDSFLVHRDPDFTLDIPMRTSSDEILNVISNFKNLVREEYGPEMDISGYVDVESISEEDFEDLITDPNFSFSGSRIITHTNQKAIAINQAIRQTRGLPEHFVEGERVVLNRYVRQSNKSFKTDSEYVIAAAYGPYECYNTGSDYYTYIVLDGWGIRYEMNSLDFDLRSMYCSTVYKAQGRSFNTIYIDLAGFPNNISRSILVRSLYVGASRARNKIVFVGELSEHVAGKL